ncbi:MAG: helix-turn-helix domain-containing protein [Lachnospiraceae bacterium]|nr:helix-turn-helix domain-containing protein [Lachnospiraceae bacterium]
MQNQKDEQHGIEHQDENQLQSMLECARETLKDESNILIADIYEKNLVVFIDLIQDKNAYDLADKLAADLEEKGMSSSLYLCNYIGSTADARLDYVAIGNFTDAVSKIYLPRAVYTIQEIRFAEECEELIAQGELAVQNYLKILNPLVQNDKEMEKELHRTLAVYLLDAHSNIAETAELMFLHKNTIKYRIRKINELLRLNVAFMPESYNYYRAMALERLLEKQENKKHRV